MVHTFILSGVQSTAKIQYTIYVNSLEMINYEKYENLIIHIMLD